MCIWVSQAGCRDWGRGLGMGCLCVGQGTSIVWVSPAGCRDLWGEGRVGGCLCVGAGYECYVGVTGRL